MSENRYEIVFPPDYHGQWEDECVSKGRLSGVLVRLPSGSVHTLTFVDMARLAQMVEDQLAAGFKHFSEPGLVIVEEVSRANIESAVRELMKEGFLEAR